MELLYKKQITMKKIKLIKITILLLSLYSQGYSQKIALIQNSQVSTNIPVCPAFEDVMLNSFKFFKLNVVHYYDMNFFLQLNFKNVLNGGIVTANCSKRDLKEIPKKSIPYADLGYQFMLIPINSVALYYICDTSEKAIVSYLGPRWVEYMIYNLNNSEKKVVKLTISADYNSMLPLFEYSNIDKVAKEINDFVKGNSTAFSNNNDAVVKDNIESIQQSNSSSKKNNSFVGASEGKFKVVRTKERNPSNNQPVFIDVYDKSLSLKVGDNIIITRTDEVKIPGEKNSIASETTIGKAKITEDFNKPLYTAKLIANAGFNMKDYKDGDENYNAVKGEATKTIVVTPKIMVIPKKIDPSKYVNGEYLLSKEEKMLIAAFKNKFEDNKYTTYGFESSLKSILENRQFNDNIKDDIKSKILESSGMDFFVEYENLDQSNPRCDKVFDFKIRNYSTGEDVASDVKSLFTCGTPDDYKNFASTILNSGAISKINTQFSSLLTNGRKVSVILTISNASQANFNKEYNGTKLKDHIENCLQGIAYNGNLDIEGVVDLRMETTINIPIINENSGKSYTTNTFSEDVVSYLKNNAGVECESSVSKQIVNIKIK
jgi:hypothetical protein